MAEIRGEHGAPEVGRGGAVIIPAAPPKPEQSRSKSVYNSDADAVRRQSRTAAPPGRRKARPFERETPFAAAGQHTTSRHERRTRTNCGSKSAQRLVSAAVALSGRCRKALKPRLSKRGGGDPACRFLPQSFERGASC